ncbi:MAG TPA: radical SAM protein [bacterium]|nr:radical SAM protein [bacterium]HQP98764.1 radical SAM protein [bacterium]
MTPPCSMEQRYGDLSGAGSGASSLGILTLAAVVRAGGRRVSVLDASAENLSFQQALNRVEALGPRIVGLSITTLSVLPAQQFAKELKDRRSDLTVLIGGPHATAVPEQTLQSGNHFDVAVIGEGEQTLPDLLGVLIDGGDLSKVRGIVYRDSQGKIIRTENRETIVDLDSLPFPAWDLLSGFPQAYNPPYFKVRRLPSTSLVTSRGCPYTCIFCDTSVFGDRVRGYSPEYLLEMIRHLVTDYRIRDLTFEDDTFMLLPRRLQAICEALIRSNLRLSWSCNSRVDLVKPDLLDLMRRAGCWHISFGIESGSQAILDRLGKRITLAQIEEAVRITRRAGIRAKGFFIVGSPGETIETLEQTDELMHRLPLSDVSVMCMTPFPGSPLSQEASLYGTMDNDWACMNLIEPAFVPHGLTKEDLRAWHSRLLREFYKQPRIWIDYAARAIRHPSPRFIWGAVRSALALRRSGKLSKPENDRSTHNPART